MAKKKVTKKKTQATAGSKKPKVTKKSKTKKKPAAKVSKKTTSKSPASKKTAKKTPTKKTIKKKTTASKPTKKKTTKKAVVTASTSKKPTTKKKTTGKKSRSAKRPAPDANGYVIINGRRVRMMSVSTVPPPPVKKVRSRAKTASEPEPSEKNRKVVKTKLSRKDLDHYRTLLLIKRRELAGDLSAMEAQALRANGGQISHMPIHMADVGTDNFDQDFMLGMAETERERLREIDAALKRIEEKTYGICQMTDRVIPKTRLNAKPWARYTIEAARQIERGLGE